MDEWFDTKQEAEKRCEELKDMFDWLYERNNRSGGPCDVWVEEKV